MKYLTLQKQVTILLSSASFFFAASVIGLVLKKIFETDSPVLKFCIALSFIIASLCLVRINLLTGDIEENYETERWVVTQIKKYLKRRKNFSIRT